MISLPLYCFAALASLLSTTAAHGWVHSHVLDHATYTGYLPVSPTPVWSNPPPSIARKIGYEGPVLDILTRNITCNVNAAPISDNGVSRVGEVTAGTTVEFWWGTGWPHEGPMSTYMARCTPDCGSWNGWESAAWFKIDEKGYNETWGGWATQYLFDQGGVWRSTIPACLPAGEYLIRHEIMAMSECKTIGKCQFYPNCAQLRVLASGAEAVQPGGSADVGNAALVSFPGAYQQRDPGIYWNSNTQLPVNYVVPGPKVWKCPS